MRRYRILLLAALALIACNRPENPDDQENPENPDNPGKLTEISVEGATGSYYDLPEFHVTREKQTLKIHVKSPTNIWEWELDSNNWLFPQKNKDTLICSILENRKTMSRCVLVTVRYGTDEGQHASFYVSQDSWIQYDEQWKDKEEAVDLGLSVLWGSVNLGAASPDRTGAYFSWGETRIKDYFGWNSYQHWGEGTSSIKKYNSEKSNGKVDNKSRLDPEDDAAVFYLGGKWRMPTVQECEELADNCTISSDTINGNPVRILTSKKNGNRIIIPRANGLREDYVAYDGTHVWSASLAGKYSHNAWYLDILTDSGSTQYKNISRHEGLPVRPVMDKD